MERKTFIFAVLCVAALLLPSCEKDKDFAQREMKVTDAEVEMVVAKRATFSARCDYPGKWKAVLEVSASHDMANPQSFEAEADGKTITAEATGLELATAYFGRITVSNKFAEAHSDVFSFSTSDGLPVVATGDLSEIKAASAICGGNVIDDGGFPVTERGICYGQSPNPTLENAQHIVAGSGTGEFSATLTGLAPNTKYYLRAYATNIIDTTYADDEKNFVTRDGILVVATGNITEIRATSAKCSGNVTDDGGSSVTERGICYGRTPNPTLVNAQHITAGSDMGEFSVTLNGLEESTLYYVCAYATNSCETRYGEDVTFSTFSTHSITFTTPDGVSFTMIPVEGGTFWMGAQNFDHDGQNYYPHTTGPEREVHQVTLSSFYMGETEVTQALWQAVMGSNPSYNTGDSQRPVEQVSWDDCQQFITKLNQLCASQLNGRQFVLPTEAEWEYAARGGRQNHGYMYSGSNTFDDVAWWTANSGWTTHAVGTKQANELGLYDMSGNVFEWCQDWFEWGYDSSAQTNPTGPSSGELRVCRGGSYNFDFLSEDTPFSCSVSYRGYEHPDFTNRNHGLRLSLR